MERALFLRGGGKTRRVIGWCPTLLPMPSIFLISDSPIPWIDIALVSISIQSPGPESRTIAQTAFTVYRSHHYHLSPSLIEHLLHVPRYDKFHVAFEIRRWLALISSPSTLRKCHRQEKYIGFYSRSGCHETDLLSTWGALTGLFPLLFLLVVS